MALKSVTLRLDEGEYEKLKEYLSEFGDPDINVAYVLRSYIRDLNRALPFVKSGWDLKNYFGMLGSWLKQFSSTQDQEMFAKMMANPWAFWNNHSSHGHGKEGEDTVELKKKSSEEKQDKGKGHKA